MERTYKAVIIGAAHMHALYMAQDCLDNPRITLCGMADTRPLMQEHPGAAPFTRRWNTAYVTGRLGVRYWTDYLAMLDECSPDIAFVSTETPLHAEVFRECARRGVAVSVEKPMAATLAEGYKMKRIAAETGGALYVNWPLAWMPFMPQLKQILAEGRLGRLLKVRQIVGHPGPLGRGVRHPRVEETSDSTTPLEKAGTWWHNEATAGGAMLDFCCYGAMACNWLIGERAQAAMGMRCNTNSQWGSADDNAAMLVRYPNCLAVLEGSWTAPVGSLSQGPELYGSEAMAYLNDRDGNAAVVIRDYSGGVTELPQPAPLPHLKNITTAFAYHMDTGEPMPDFLDMDVNLDVLAILDAGVRSAKSGKTELVNNIAWEIG